MSDERDQNIRFSIPKAWLDVIKSYILPGLLAAIVGGEGFVMINDKLQEGDASEKYAIGIRCDAAECVYRDEHNQVFKARRDKFGRWIYEKQGKWYVVADNSEYKWWSKTGEDPKPETDH